jgi:hypothetical protein
MPGWGDILAEIQGAAQPDGSVDVDSIRRKYLAQLNALTGRSVVSYATDFLSVGGPQVQVELGDMTGLMEVFRDLPGPNLDLILHSPGGQAEATERLVRYMRSKFEHIRVFVPLAAMSAATMWAMAADEVVMGKHSQLGPIDPQVGLPTGVSVPAGALIEQFQEAVDVCSSDPSKITGWLPTLQQYPPGLLNVCESAAALSKKLVAQWLEQYMMAGQTDAAARAESIAEWLANDKVHLSHGRAITREELAAQGVTIVELESDQALQDAVLSVHHATTHTLSMGSAVKIIENHIGRAYVRHGGPMMMAPAPGP